MVMFAIGLTFFLANSLSEEGTGQESSLRKEVFELSDGFGYQILNNGKVLVRQEYIPVISGNMPFKSQEDADRMADLVMEKIEKGKSPRVNLEELESLEIVRSNEYILAVP